MGKLIFNWNKERSIIDILPVLRFKLYPYICFLQIEFHFLKFYGNKYFDLKTKRNKTTKDD